MGRLLDALRAEVETRPAATPATPATLDPQSRRVASVAAPHDLETGRLLAALRAQGLPDAWLGLDHGEPTLLAALTDRQLTAYVAMLAETDLRRHGKVPADETAMALCRGCGPVWVHPHVASVAPVVNGWARLLGCPWCHVRHAGLYVPRPPVTCGDCQRFTRDTINPSGGMGSCGAGCDPARPYPHAQTQCGSFTPKATQ